ncbi:hypothetical protein CYLTODRAFT_433938 [Cylindrobasidium torrendii FP15055 ss-10]|uniref:Mitochondrial distribution and morphology protein 34 n=1 Tax=Cylindrobasidium torrendii FP15055 ss-10 TaxID=1314674 RepID=A0A0D7BTK9_9AGAR|nr:hypothetical protein CYLTODRAFT_433938 [Cylindrobasidium torrendii FP15055 ss-10]
MSFTFNWPRFSDQFHYDAIQMLNTALNKGDKPPIIADKIEVVELEMGTEPPELEIREIGEMTMDQFRGIFRMSYAGDAHLVLKTKVQANPLNHKQPDIHLMTGTRGMLAAKQPLVVPMLLRLSHFKMRSIVVLVVSKQKGITLVFKTDPLQSVDINSTFDSIAVIQKFIQREIEGQLRQMFREDLPGIIHRLSQQWIKAKVETPYLSKRPSIPRPPQPHVVESEPDPLSFHNVANLEKTQASSLNRTHTAGYTPSRVSSTRRAPVSIRSAPVPAPAPDPDNDLENFDPTYGLRPEGLPSKSMFTGLRSLFHPTRGLADLTEEGSEDLNEYDDESVSFDMVDWDAGRAETTPPSSILNEGRETTVTEYETIPAVGGGTITRPRIYHSQSLLANPAEAASSIDFPPRTPSSPHPFAPFALNGMRRTNSLNGTYFPDSNSSPRSSVRPLHGVGISRPSSFPNITTASVDKPTVPASASVDDNLIPRRHPSSHKASISEQDASLSFRSASPPTYTTVLEDSDSSPKIIIRPTLLSNTISHLSTLSHSHHTLSPYTRSMQHFTVRSGPPRFDGGASPEKLVKARRKRTIRLGGTTKPTPAIKPSSPIDPIPSPLPPVGLSEFDMSDMDRYFRSHDEVPHGSPKLHPSHVRLRPTYNRLDGLP